MSASAPVLSVALVGGLLVLASYALFIVPLSGGAGYLAHPAWMGISRQAIPFIIAVQLLSVLGFFLCVGPWALEEEPQGGIFEPRWALPVVLAVYMLASAAWSVFTANYLASKGVGAKAGAVFSLFLVALCSIAMCVGAATEDPRRPYVLVGAVLLALTNVLSDGIVWNAHLLAHP